MVGFFDACLLCRNMEMMQWTTAESSLGTILLGGNSDGLCGLWFEGQKHIPSLLPTWRNDRLEIFEETRMWLDIYFAGQEPDFTPRIVLNGTTFRNRVWNELLRIPYGATITYGELAKKVGCHSARAIGNAVGHNPISIIVPCHRVVGSGGTLTGYAGGIDRKKALLTMEGVSR